MSGNGQRRELGELLRHYRSKPKWSQLDLANEAGLSSVAVNQLENDPLQVPQQRTVANLVGAFQLSGDDRREFEQAVEKRRQLRRERDVGGPQTAHLPHKAWDSFVGRSDDVARLAALLGSSRMVTATGTAGVGKTRLALELAAEISHKWKHGVRFVDLSSLPNETSPINRIASEIGVRVTTASDPLADVAKGLKTRNLLLILDNCEHLIVGTRDVASAILRQCPQVTILATSRERLRITGEVVHHVSVLPVPTAGVALTAKQARSFAAIELFSQRAVASQQNFTLSDASVDTVAAICRRLDGIPLAIELIAARLSGLTVDELWKRLDAYFEQNLGLISNERSDAPARHQTLRGAIAWSHDLLTDDERVLFRRASIFLGGWTLEASQAVCDGNSLTKPIFELLASLVDKSVVVLNSAAVSARYSFFETTRAFAREKLESAGEEVLLRNRHLAWIASFADQSDLEGWNQPLAEWLPPLIAEFENARAALSWAQGLGIDRRSAGIIAAAIGRWAFSCGLFSDARTCVESELERAHDISDSAVTARLWYALSPLTAGGRRVELLEGASNVYRELGDQRRLAQTLVRLGGGYVQTADYEKASRTLREAHSLLRRLGEARSSYSAIALSWLATAYQATSRFAEAREKLGDSIQIFTRIGDAERATIEKINLAELEFAAGDPKCALKVVREAIDFFRADSATGFRMGSSFQVVALQNAAGYAIVLDDVECAYAYARASLAESQRTGQTNWTTISVQHLGTVAAMRGAMRTASVLCGYCEETLERHKIVREPTERRTFEIFLQKLRAQRSEKELADSMAEGALLTEEEAIDLATAT